MVGIGYGFFDIGDVGSVEFGYYFVCGGVMGDIVFVSVKVLFVSNVDG